MRPRVHMPVVAGTSVVPLSKLVVMVGMALLLPLLLLLPATSQADAAVLLPLLLAVAMNVEKPARPTTAKMAQ